ncbi:hypothetical protein E1B28_012308 [Marasmius oreades]|uniref:Regulatory protein ral2 n=1 Tax=Marasmius oreades TaxID=181124 RepID=A0A9P7RRX7_9AGAR|nr:uncharacterized protein E1B28_012308 [Marasmius oreades]KAG7088298.1 hypothetical protein E1B28_012308 [Marasmius oreades]
MLHSIYDLTTSCRKTSGEVPAKLVGASTTVVGSKMYVFGGRLVSERKMISDVYVFDLESFVWEKIQPFPEDDIPRPRYFHSADAWNNQLIIFGGMSNQPDSHNPDELCVLNDVRFFDLSTRHWIPPSQFPTPVSETFVPRARYAHLSSVTADRLFIIGGQDFFNTWLDDICVYDLLGKTWVQRRDYPRHCGTYRSVAVASNLCVRRAHDEKRDSSNLGAPGTRFRDTDTPTQLDFTSTDSLVHLPYSTAPTEDYPSNIYLYSNYNFTDVKRELEVFSPLPDTDFTIQDRSAAMTGSSFPPGLRFPTGAILGTNLIIAGTYLAHTNQSFSIWVLDLLTMTWSRIETGKAVDGGSWFRGCLWADANKFLIFGNRNGHLVDDYNRRLLSWEHVAVVDLEAFGIYQPPPLKRSIDMQELGLAALEEGVLADFELICDDGRRISCSRKILEDRWPWFKDQMRKFLLLAMDTSAQLPTSPMHVDNPILPGATSSNEQRPDPRMTPRTLHLSEPYAITLALVRYFYTLALLTPLQLAPAVLSQLLVLATNYRIPHLELLVKHAMHRALSNSTSVGVYEIATLCGCRSLQIRALRRVMTYTQTQKKPGSKRNDRENGSGSRPPDGGSGGGPPGSGTEGSDTPTSRPRGTSDARWQTADSDTNNLYNSHMRTYRTSARTPAYDTTATSNIYDDHDHDHDPSPLPVFTRQNPVNQNQMNRSSVVSIATDRELRDVADIIEPMVRLPLGRPTHSRAYSDDANVYIDPAMYPRSEPSPSRFTQTPSFGPRSESSSRYNSPTFGSPSSYSSENQYDVLSPDGRVDRVYLPPSPMIPSFHLPLMPPFTQTPSLGSASSSSESQYDGLSTDGRVDRVYFPPSPIRPSFHLPMPPSRPSHLSDGAGDVSDVPSLHLSTSRSSMGSSKGYSPSTPSMAVTPPEYITDSPPLSIIDERGHEEHYHWAEHTRNPGFTAVSDRSDLLPQNGLSKRKPPLERSFTASTTSVSSDPLSLESERHPPIAPVSGKKGGGLSRLLKLGKGDDHNSSALDQAEEKKRKKEAAKIKTERLAQDLRKRELARRRQQEDSMSLSSNERKKQQDGRAMYGGMAGFTL